MKNETSLPHVVIVGAGFGGLNAARAFKDKPVRVTIIDRQNFHLFQPLLYQVATAGLSPQDITYPVRGILRKQKNVEFRLTEAKGIDTHTKMLLSTCCDVPYDYLILAVGGVTNTFGMQDVAEYGLGLKSIHDANSIRNHLLRCFELASQSQDIEEQRSLLTFVVVGGGPSGVECSGAISELIRLVLSKDYPRLDTGLARVILLEATQRLLPGMPEDLGQATMEALQKKKVEVRFGAQVTGFDTILVTLKDGSVIPAQTLIWAAGVKAAELVEKLDAERGSQGRVKVAPTLQVPGHPDIFVIGDAAYLEENGHGLPMVAPVAIQQAQHAAMNILNSINHQPLQPFKYHDKGSLATIGRNQAVAYIGGLKFKGLFAWLVWLVVHIMQLIGFRNRLVVLVNWAWDYFFFDRALRLITPER
jgi:NADH dehydrogenase